MYVYVYTGTANCASIPSVGIVVPLNLYGIMQQIIYKHSHKRTCKRLTNAHNTNHDKHYILKKNPIQYELDVIVTTMKGFNLNISAVYSM